MVSAYLTQPKRTEYEARLERAAREFVRDFPQYAPLAAARWAGWDQFAFGYIAHRFRSMADES